MIALWLIGAGAVIGVGTFVITIAREVVLEWQAGNISSALFGGGLLLAGILLAVGLALAGGTL